MTPNPVAITLLHQLEGCKLIAYPDVDGYACGYGTHAPDVADGTVWTQDEADARLVARVVDIQAQIIPRIETPLTNNQLGAILSLTYNIGVGAFLGSTMLKYINAGQISMASAEFPRWNRSSGVVDPVLVARRTVERAMFDKKTS